MDPVLALAALHSSASCKHSSSSKTVRRQYLLPAGERRANRLNVGALLAERRHLSCGHRWHSCWCHGWTLTY